MVSSGQADAFRDWLAALISESRLTKWQVAQAVGVHPSAVSHWLGPRKSLPDFPQVVAICRWAGELPPELADLCPSPEEDEGEGS